MLTSHLLKKEEFIYNYLYAMGWTKHDKEENFDHLILISGGGNHFGDRE
jgi:hypothetical protein